MRQTPHRPPIKPKETKRWKYLFPIASRNKPPPMLTAPEKFRTQLRKRSRHGLTVNPTTSQLKRRDRLPSKSRPVTFISTIMAYPTVNYTATISNNEDERGSGRLTCAQCYQYKEGICQKKARADWGTSSRVSPTRTACHFVERLPF